MMNHLTCFKSTAKFAFFGTLLLLGLISQFVGVLAADEPVPVIQLGAPFGDNAVLQRQMQVPVWGWSEPGKKITVQFADQEKSATANDAGKWSLELDALEASFEPREMTIRDDQGSSVVLKNILVGEVWMASGQSNMQWTVQNSSSNRLVVEPVGENKIAPIREFKINNVYAMLHPIEKAEGTWKDGDYGNYSAIAFAFAHRLYHELNVPIGILNCSFSQTSIQAWVPREGFRDGEDEVTKAIYQQILETDPSTPEHQAAWSQFYNDIEKTLLENQERAKNGQPARFVSKKTPGNLQGNRDATWLFNGHLNPVIPFAIRGCIWNQGYANMGEGLVYYHHLHSLVRGWRLCWNRPELPVYFHQFYCPNQTGQWNNDPDFGGTAEMRLATYLARDIPHTGMASQIDITGAIHYWNKAVPGQRLALHALKNQYQKNIVVDGPMFRSYSVTGNQLVVEFENAEGGLVVAETGSNSDRRNPEATGCADPKIMENGDASVKLFYLADENRTWYPADMKIVGDKVVLTSPKVKQPCGVSYATGGVGIQPNLYNQALLPTTPFIYYDQEMVTKKTWSDETLKVDGKVIDPSTVGKIYEWRKMPLLSTQFKDNAVFQAGVPITIWGSLSHDYGYEAEGKAEIQFSFAGVEKTIDVDSDPAIVALEPGESRYQDGKEWRVTLPPMEASAEPKTLKVTFLIDGEIAHQRICKNIVIGDVWYVAAPALELELPGEAAPSRSPEAVVRVMKRSAKRSANGTPSRYSVAVSTIPDNRYASVWKDAEPDFAGMLGHKIAAKTGRPVGIIFMQNMAGEGGTNPPLKSWIAADWLKHAPSLQDDYRDLAGVRPGNEYYDASVQRYLADWKQYWKEYVPAMMTTKSVPDGAAWGSYPMFASNVTSNAAETYNVLVHSFTPAGLKGILFIASPDAVSGEVGDHFEEQISVLANCWKQRFGGVAGGDVPFFYAIPKGETFGNVSANESIIGKSQGYVVGLKMTAKNTPFVPAESVSQLIDEIIKTSY